MVVHASVFGDAPSRLGEGDSCIAPDSAFDADGNVRGHRVFRRGGADVREPFETRCVADVVNGASSDDAMLCARRAFGSYSQLQPFAEFTVELLEAGTSGEIVAPDAHYLVSGNKMRGSTYFDLTAFGRTSVAVYSRRSAVAGVVHSGDAHNMALSDEAPFTTSATQRVWNGSRTLAPPRRTTRWPRTFPSARKVESGAMQLSPSASRLAASPNTLAWTTIPPPRSLACGFSDLPVL
jgi:hypothetical protein